MAYAGGGTQSLPSIEVMSKVFKTKEFRTGRKSDFVLLPLLLFYAIGVGEHARFIPFGMLNLGGFGA